MKYIPYGKQSIDEEDIKSVIDVLKSEWITTGPKVEEFERALASYVGAKHAVAVNSGTSALDIAVGALELPVGSEIITTPFTFIASSNCILYNNCKPIFVDIKPDTYNIDPQEITKRITDKTKAIIYVDYAGQPCDIDEIREIAEEHSLRLIEDAAHAIGAEYKGKRVGSFADMTVFSFHPVKHITTGEGGAVTTDNEEFYEKLKMLRNHGMDKSVKERFGPDVGYQYDVKMLGKNYRVTDFQCALGLSQLKKLDSILKRREEIVKKYNEEFSKLPELTIPFVKPNVRSAWHLYTILLDKKINRDQFFSSMRSKGVGVNVHYIPVYHFSYYKKFGINSGNYPNTEEIFSRIITLPFYPTMTEENINAVVEAVKESIKGATRG